MVFDLFDADGLTGEAAEPKGNATKRVAVD
jgi:hypothetical protein